MMVAPIKFREKTIHNITYCVHVDQGAYQVIGEQYLHGCI